MGRFRPKPGTNEAGYVQWNSLQFVEELIDAPVASTASITMRTGTLSRILDRSARISRMPKSVETLFSVEYHFLNDLFEFQTSNQFLVLYSNRFYTDAVTRDVETIVAYEKKWGQDLRGLSAPVDWVANEISFAVPGVQGQYAFFIDETSTLMTDIIDLSMYDTELRFQVAKRDTGDDGPITVRQSLDGGATFQLLGDSSVPTSATYVESMFPISQTSDRVRFLFSREKSPSGKRLRDVELVVSRDVLQEALVNGSLPPGWQQHDIDFRTLTGGYALFDNSSAPVPPAPYLSTPVFDANDLQTISVTFDVAKFGSGVDGPLTVEVSIDGGSTFREVGDSDVPPDANYLTCTVHVGQTSATMVIRFTRPRSPSRKRLRNVYIRGFLKTVEPLFEPLRTDLFASVTNIDGTGSKRSAVRRSKVPLVEEAVDLDDNAAMDVDVRSDPPHFVVASRNLVVAEPGPFTSQQRITTKYTLLDYRSDTW